MFPYAGTPLRLPEISQAAGITPSAIAGFTIIIGFPTLLLILIYNFERPQ